MQAIIWLVLLLIFLAVESATVTLVSVWFAAGSLAALLVSLFCPILWIQAVVFLVVSCIMLAMLRPMVRKYITPKITKTNVDSVVGTIGTVTQTINNLEAVGQVKLGAMFWTARSADGSILPEGTRVRVESIEGVKVIVVPAEESAE